MKISSFEDLMKYISRYRNNPKKISKIKDNFNEYIDLCNEQNIIDCINEIKNIPEIENTLYYNSDSIYRKFGIGTILKITQEMEFRKRFKYIHEMYEGIRLKYYTIDEFLDNLMEYNENEYICNNMEQVINYSDIHSLIKLNLLKKLQKLDSDKFEKIHSLIVSRMANVEHKFIDSTILFGLTTIVDEIANNENVDISDVEYIATGNFTNVYKLGNKAIKFGKNRLTDKIPYHKRILQPLIRRKVLSGINDLYIEISEYVQTDSSITDEDAYLVYKELRNDGIIWVDAKRENLGKLEKDNIAHFNETLYVKNETVGYIPETLHENEPLQKGDLVIIDTDFLFRENDFDITHLDTKINTDFYKICEQRSQEEKRFKKNNEIINKPKNIMER